jgi:hypothetical protein
VTVGEPAGNPGQPEADRLRLANHSHEPPGSEPESAFALLACILQDAFRFRQMPTVSSIFHRQNRDIARHRAFEWSRSGTTI